MSGVVRESSGGGGGGGDGAPVKGGGTEHHQRPSSELSIATDHHLGTQQGGGVDRVAMHCDGQ